MQSEQDLQEQPIQETTQQPVEDVTQTIVQKAPQEQAPAEIPNPQAPEQAKIK